METKDLPKDKRASVRINEKIDRALREKGLSIQKVLDNALEELFEVEINVKEKEK